MSEERLEFLQLETEIQEATDFTMGIAIFVILVLTGLTIYIIIKRKSSYPPFKTGYTCKSFNIPRFCPCSPAPPHTIAPISCPSPHCPGPSYLCVPYINNISGEKFYNTLPDCQKVCETD